MVNLTAILSSTAAVFSVSSSSKGASQGGWLPKICAASGLSISDTIGMGWQKGLSSSSVSIENRDTVRGDYSEVNHLCQSFGLLDEEDPLFLDDEVVKSGCQLLNRLDAFEVPPPQAFAHGGDALVLKWRFGESQQFLTICDNVATYYRKGDGAASEKLYDLNKRADIIRLALAFGGKIWTLPANT